MHTGGTTGGGFRQELDWLVEELTKAGSGEIGRPRERERGLLLRSAARCPAAHNHFLIDRQNAS